MPMIRNFMSHQYNNLLQCYDMFNIVINNLFSFFSLYEENFLVTQRPILICAHQLLFCPLQSDIEILLHRESQKALCLLMYYRPFFDFLEPFNGISVEYTIQLSNDDRLRMFCRQDWSVFLLQCWYLGSTSKIPQQMLGSRAILQMLKRT